MKLKLAAIAYSIALSACATSAPAPVALTTIFDPAEVAWFKQVGSNTIKASALLRQQGGGVVTCAGNEMRIFPVSKYAGERMHYIYGNQLVGFSRAGNANLPAPPGEYWEYTKTKTCDPQGFATFADLPDGEYFIATNVQWSVPQGSGYFIYQAQQGGALMKRVNLTGGETEEIVLTAN